MQFYVQSWNRGRASHSIIVVLALEDNPRQITSLTWDTCNP